MLSLRPRSASSCSPRSRWALVSLAAVFLLLQFVFVARPAFAARTINVPGDAATIQAGIDLAQAGDTVLVASGTYLESSTIHVNKSITLASWYHTTGLESYIGQTIIDSTASTTLDVTAAGAGALVKGFTIKGPDKGIQVLAKADVTHCTFQDTGGDSLSWEDGGAGRFANNRFVNCGDDCIDSDNDSNGVAGGDRIIENSTMNGADDDCIEIRLQDYSSAEMKYHVRYNTIENCTDDGVQLIDYSGASNRRFEIHHNLIRSTGASGVGATANGSTSQDGSGSPLVEPVQIHNNTIIADSGGPKWGVVGGANMLVVNNVIRGATLYALRMLQGSSWAAYNDLYQNAANADATSQPLVGEGMLYTDPLLDSAYRLLSGSPCIDAGIAHYEKNGQVMDVPAAEYSGTAPDLGAFEYGNAGPSNQPPSVNAGPDRQIHHPTNTVSLDGTVTDDGNPSGTLNIAWSKMEGPGTVTFSSPTTADTDATFSRQGTYKLKLEASDGELTSADSTVVKYVQDGSGAKIDIAAPGSTYFEAEAYSWLYAPATVAADSAASGGSAVLGPDGQGTDARSEYTLALRQEGYSYYVWVRMAGPDASGDTLAVSFDNGTERLVSTTGDGAYRWQKMDGSFPSPAGEYPLIVRAAEDGVRWDRIVVTTDAGFVPTDTPPNRVDVRVAASTDDAEEGSTGGVVLTSTDLEFVTDASTQTVGIRFPGVAIPPNSRIVSASVQFQVDEVSTAATTLTINGHAADNAPTFTTASANISSRPKTVASVSWLPPAWSTIGAAGVDQRTPDITAVVQEIVSRPGWQSGNALALIVIGSGKRVAVADDGSPSGAPLLTVEYVPQGAVSEPPAPPSGLTASAVSNSQINLAWTDNATNEDGFKIERCQGSGCSNFAQIATVGANVTTYSDSGLAASTTYSYRVRAHNSVGDSAYSNTASATTQAPPALPTAPSNLAASPNSPSQIGLTWTDNATTESGFRIERCTGSGCTNFAEVATTGANVTTYQDNGLSATTSYSYRVRAYNAGGNSGYSNVASATTPAAPARLPAFPGAEGFGAYAAGGRGGKVYEVTNLDDSGPGSLRACVQASGPRTCVFRTGGTINLAGTLSVSNPYITIAGQTAPGGGIALRGYDLDIKTHDVIVRHLRVRTGDEHGSSEPDGIAIKPSGSDSHPTRNVILDHCSISWGVDETASFWSGYDLPTSAGGWVKDVTVQWSIVSEGLVNAGHSQGAHSMGLLIGDHIQSVSLHHNLFAHNNKRNPEIKGDSRLEVINNVMYDWGSDGIRIYNSHAETAGQWANIIGNYGIPGASTTTGCNRRLVYMSNVVNEPQIYVEGNIDAYRTTDQQAQNLAVCNNTSWALASAPIAAVDSGVERQSAFVAKDLVLERAGAILPARDATDRRVVDDVRNGTGSLIDSQAQVGGWPVLAAGTAPVDADHDGMPDSWEIERGLNPSVDDGAGDRNGDGYTNLEEYINGIVGSPADANPPTAPTGLRRTDQR